MAVGALGRPELRELNHNARYAESNDDNASPRWRLKGPVKPMTLQKLFEDLLGAWKAPSLVPAHERHEFERRMRLEAARNDVRAHIF